jgi:hypothetical protein
VNCVRRECELRRKKDLQKVTVVKRRQGLCGGAENLWELSSNADTASGEPRAGLSVLAPLARSQPAVLIPPSYTIGGLGIAHPVLCENSRSGHARRCVNVAGSMRQSRSSTVTSERRRVRASVSV